MESNYENNAGKESCQSEDTTLMYNHEYFEVKRGTLRSTKRKEKN